MKGSDHQPEQPPTAEIADLDPIRPEMESVTEVNGTVAHFEMTYSPVARRAVTFGPPLRQRLPSLLFLAFGGLLVALVVVAYYGASSNSAIYIWIVEGDRARPLPAAVLAGVIFLSGLGTVLRARMRGVLVHPDGIEARYLLPMGVPRVRRWTWAQVERVVLDDNGAMLELWDSTYARLPDVGDPQELARLLQRIAAERKIVVTRLKD
ncbi:MAG TPA: hypothetical protein VGI39_16295 [Polyangiaceae bacterium]